ncbi:hypothetical protein EI555_019770, partial [Monodon monoceros]
MHPSGLAVTSCRAANSQVQTFPVYWQKTTLKNLDGVRRVENLGMEAPRMNPVLEPLSWMLGTWLSDPPGAGTFPTLQPFQYLEEVHISHVGQPMLNFSFNAFHPDTHKPMHRECGFIRLEPDTNKVAFVSAQNTGIVEVEEGEVNGQELCIASHSIARTSFAKEPHVEQPSPVLSHYRGEDSALTFDTCG